MSDSGTQQEPLDGQDPAAQGNPSPADTGGGQGSSQEQNPGGSAAEGSTDAGSGQEGAGAGETGQGEAQAVAQAQARGPAPDWRNKRIDQLTARLREAQAELARAKAGEAGPATTGVSPPPADIEALANARALEIAQVNEFNRACNEVAQAGRQAFPDFNGRIDALRGLVNPADPSEAQSYNTFLASALETGEAHRLLHHLGGNLDEAQRILSLPPTKMAMELAKLAVRPPEQLSQAPKPIRPIAGGRQGPHTAIAPDDPERADNLSTAEWMRRREEQIAARSGTRH